MFYDFLAKPDEFILHNIKTANHAIWLLKYLSFIGYRSTDDIMNRLCYLFLLNIPNEKYLANISLLLQSLDKRNNNQEYAILTIWICANLAIIENENNKKGEIKSIITITDNLDIQLKLYFN